MQHIVGVDIGGTKIHAARIHGDNIEQSDRRLVSSKGTEAQVVEEVIATIEAVFDATVSGIGVGVPSIVDTEKGIVYVFDSSTLIVAGGEDLNEAVKAKLAAPKVP